MMATAHRSALITTAVSARKKAPPPNPIDLAILSCDCSKLLNRITMYPIIPNCTKPQNKWAAMGLQKVPGLSQTQENQPNQTTKSSTLTMNLNCDFRNLLPPLLI